MAPSLDQNNTHSVDAARWALDHLEDAHQGVWKLPVLCKNLRNKEGEGVFLKGMYYRKLMVYTFHNCLYIVLGRMTALSLLWVNSVQSAQLGNVNWQWNVFESWQRQSCQHSWSCRVRSNIFECSKWAIKSSNLAVIFSYLEESLGHLQIIQRNKNVLCTCKLDTDVTVCFLIHTHKLGNRIPIWKVWCGKGAPLICPLQDLVFCDWLILIPPVFIW